MPARAKEGIKTGQANEGMVIGEFTPEASFTRIEEEVRRFWRRHEVPETFYAARQGGSPYILSQQPLMAAGASRPDQARLVATADLLARYHTMRGEAVQRRTGWIGHGLPVEVAVERALGSAVADYDLARFNGACRQAASEGVKQLEALAEWLAVWPGPGSTFYSLEPQAVGAVWGALRRLWEAGRLRSERRVVSVCPRCATPLSSAEASLRVVDVEAQAVWLRLPWEGEPGAYLLVWTPMPWTLVGMVALAAHPEATYALVERSEEEPASPDQPAAQPARLLLAESALHRLEMGGVRLVRRLSGRALRGVRYRPPFTFLPAGADSGRVLLSDQVPLSQRAGLWPVTPSFDPFSLALARSHDLPVPDLLDNWGGLGDAVMPWRGLAPLDAEPLLVEDLRARGLIFEEQVLMRPQARCPFCDTSLLPLARVVWLVETGTGPWIVGRDRAWGVPLPVWVCAQCGEQMCLAGLDDLAHRAGLEAGQLDPHRPGVDRLVFPCPSCSGTMRRVAAVVDAAFEAAVLSWSTTPPAGPADLAIGLGDRHLGWPGNLAEIAALLWSALAWEQVIVLPEVGPEPAWNLDRALAADAVRWASYAGTTPGLAERDFLRPMWRLALSFLGLVDEAGDELTRSPGALVGWRDGSADLLDRWCSARLHQAGGAVTQALNAREPRRAAQELVDLLADLADWYAPYRDGDGGQVLESLSVLLAPFTPYLAEAIHRRSSGQAAPSVHLEPWPSPALGDEDRALLARMAKVRRLVALGQSARAQAGIDAEQRLSQAIVGLLEDDVDELAELNPFAGLLTEALGVRRVQFATNVAPRVEWRLALDPDQRLEREVASAQIEAALADLDAGESASLAAHLRQGLSIGLRVAGRFITLLPDEVRAFALPGPGWAATADAEHLVLLRIG